MPQVKITYKRKERGMHIQHGSVIKVLEVEVDADLVHEHGYSWVAEINHLGSVIAAAKRGDRTRLPIGWVAWHNGDRKTVTDAFFDHLELSIIKNVLAGD